MSRLNLETTCVNYPVVPVGPESRHGVAGSFRLKLPGEAAVSVFIGAVV